MTSSTINMIIMTVMMPLTLLASLALAAVGVKVLSPKSRPRRYVLLVVSLVSTIAICHTLDRALYPSPASRGFRVVALTLRYWLYAQMLVMMLNLSFTIQRLAMDSHVPRKLKPIVLVCIVIAMVLNVVETSIGDHLNFAVALCFATFNALSSLCFPFVGYFLWRIITSSSMSEVNTSNRVAAFIFYTMMLLGLLLLVPSIVTFVDITMGGNPTTATLAATSLANTIAEIGVLWTFLGYWSRVVYTQHAKNVAKAAAEDRMDHAVKALMQRRQSSIDAFKNRSDLSQDATALHRAETDSSPPPNAPTVVTGGTAANDNSERTAPGMMRVISASLDGKAQISHMPSFQQRLSEFVLRSWAEDARDSRLPQWEDVVWAKVLSSSVRRRKQHTSAKAVHPPTPDDHTPQQPTFEEDKKNSKPDRLSAKGSWKHLRKHMVSNFEYDVPRNDGRAEEHWVDTVWHLMFSMRRSQQTDTVI